MILQSKEQEFRSLFSEFVKDYLKTSDGENHLRFYDEGRLKGRENFEAVKASHGDITDSVLRGLLPHTNSAAHRRLVRGSTLRLPFKATSKNGMKGLGGPGLRIGRRSREQYFALFLVVQMILNRWKRRVRSSQRCPTPRDCRLGN